MKNRTYAVAGDYKRTVFCLSRHIMTRWLTGGIICVAFLNASVALATGQQARSEIAVVIKDNGKPVPGADVEITEMNTNVTRTMRTSANGEINIRPIPVGLYLIRVQSAGRKCEKQVQVKMMTGSNLVFDLSTCGNQSGDSFKIYKLKLGSQSELNERLAAESANGLKLQSIVPREPAVSLFIFAKVETPQAGSYHIEAVEDELKAETLENKIQGQKNRIFIGVHILNPKSYLIVSMAN